MDSNKKRKTTGDENRQLAISKKQKTEEIRLYDNQEAESGLVKIEGIERTSGLKAPIMLLTGHQSDILSVRFSPNGRALASGSKDKQIFLWNVYGDCQNYLVIKGHKHAVLDLVWTKDSESIYSASCDKTIGEWDTVTGLRKCKLNEHESIVNSVDCGRIDKRLVVSVSNDCTGRLWDNRTRQHTGLIQSEYPLTSTQFLDSKNVVFVGGLDNQIHTYDTRDLSKPLYSMKGHTDTILSLKLDPYGSFLLSNSMDNTLRSWDIRPYDFEERCKKVFTGPMHHNMDASLLGCGWSNDGTYVGSGSTDRHVYIWDSLTKEIKYKLPGHFGTVTDIDFHPKEPIIASCSADKQIFLGEIEKE